MSASKCKQLIFRLNDHGQGPELLRNVFLERGWQEFNEDEQDDQDWNLWWRSSRFRNCDYDHLQSWQRLNHHPKSTAITKKDSLARNMKRMKAVHGAAVYNFSPTAFNLPNDYTKFVAHCSKIKEKDPNRQIFWICKPADLSRGRGIFLFKDLSELQYDCNAVVQQYVSSPLLISGYKFDLRIYVLVPSFSPLVVYIYNEGLVRFGTEKFDLRDIGNMFSHLTNTSINKHSPNYVADKERIGPGCKWTLGQLRSYLRQMNLDDRCLFSRIVNIIILTLITQAEQAPKSFNCFELYGFDVIIDENLKPWLLEVNFSPSLNLDSQVDLMVKKPLLNDLIDILKYTEEDKNQSGCNPPAVTRASGRSIPARYNIIDSACRPYPPALLRRQGKLPDIAPSNSRDRLAPECEDEDDGVVPIVPGCGLPSVQQPPPQQPPPSDCSGRSSSCSDLSYGSLEKVNDWRQPASHRHTLPRNLPISMCGRGALPPNGRIFHPSFSGSGNRPQPKLKKLQHMSSSAISSRSNDSVEASENMPPRKKVNTDYTVPLKGVSALEKSKRSSLQSIPHLPHASKPSSICSEVSVPDLDISPNVTRRKLPNGPSIEEKRKKKKMQQWNNSGNNLSSKSALLNKRTQSLGHLAPKPLTYTKPWERSSHNRLTGPPKPPESLPQRVGDYFLAFPFNEATRKGSDGKLDVKCIIQECQKMLKEQLNQNGQKAVPGRCLWPLFGENSS